MVTRGSIVSAPSPIPEVKPPAGDRINVARRLRRSVGSALEYLWELSGSARLYKADALLLEGRERVTGLPVRSFYFGHHDNFEFVFGRLYEDFEVTEAREGLNSLHARRWLNRFADRASLLAIDVELLYGRLLDCRRYLEIPQWIRQKYTVPDSWDRVLASFRKNTRKTDLRKVRKYGFTYRTTRSEADFLAFYHDMYVPYLRKRFGGEVIIEPEWKVLRQCRKGELMHIVRDGRTVAAVLLHLVEGRLAYVWVGVPEEIDDELFKGAFSAMYYFTILHAYVHGCHEVDFLGSRPLLNDGLFRYKRKWGTHVEDSPVPRGDILLRPLELNAPLRGFFSRNHFVVRDGRGLAGKVLLDGDPADAARLTSVCRQYETAGLTGLQLFSSSGFEADALDWVEGREGVRLVDLSGAPDPAGAFCEG